MTEPVTSFAPQVYRDRLEKLRHQARGVGVEALVITAGADFAYLTGVHMDSHERLTALILAGDQPPVVVAPVTDAAALPVHVAGELGCTLQGWADGAGQSSYQLVRQAVGDAATVAVNAGMAASHLFALREALPKVHFKLASGLLAQLTAVKDDEEIAQLAAAAGAIDRVHAAVPALLRSGSTEREVAEELEALILREHHSVDFVIVGSGPNGANPHHSFSDRVLEKGDPVVVDIGGTYGAGYRSDCTRTYVVDGDVDAAPADFRAAYQVLADAQSKARAAALAGASAQSVDAAAREPITEAGYGQFFNHRTGHGIGLSTHEEPYIMAGNELLLAPGMAFSIEPGIYLPGRWGMRLEDIVVVEAGSGAASRSLNQAERELR